MHPEMDERQSEEDPRKQQLNTARISANIASGVPVVSAKVRVIHVDSLRVEHSPTPKYLRLKNGDLMCYQSVFITLADGQEQEITVNDLPD